MRAMRVTHYDRYDLNLPVMRYSTEAEAVALANDSDDGLSAAVIASTVEEAAASVFNTTSPRRGSKGDYLRMLEEIY